MAPLAEYHEFFAASVGAAAALIGLLFVAVSVAPERTFGATADSLRRASAERAFTAFGNVFFLSFAALLPRSSLQAIAVIAVLAIVQTARVGLATWRARASGFNWHELGLISLCIYAFELSQALRMLAGADAHDGLIWIVLGLYGYALGTAWSLLGASEPPKAP